jgi:hypothetical protein
MRIKKNKIKTAIIVDFMGAGGKTQEEEIEDLKIRYSQLVQPAILTDYNCPSPYHIEPGTSLVIYDFGGLMPGTDLMDSNARELISWAEDNPNSLVMIVSSFTYKNYIEFELQNQELNLHNIIVEDYSIDDPIPQWWREIHHIPYVNKNVENETISEPPIAVEKSRHIEVGESPEESPHIPPTVSYITVPVRCDWTPEQKSGTLRFKLADCIVDIMIDDKKIADMGGAFFGFYEVSFPDGKGSFWKYSLSPEDLWPLFEKMHKELLEKEENVKTCNKT